MTATARAHGASTAVVRRLSLFDVLCIGVNAVVGSGVFALPDDIHRAMGGWSPLAYLLCTALLLPVALCFAELSSRHDETGGAYLYARSAFGPNVGFVLGWYCWVTTFVSWAANTTLFVELIGFSARPWNKLVVVGMIVALGALNYRGVKPGARLINAVTIGKLLAIGCFVAVAIMAIDPGRLGGALPTGVTGVGQGLYLALFPLQGFEVAPVAAGETSNPRRNVPIATLGALLIAALLFTIVQTALVGTYPSLGATSDRPLVDAARSLGPTLGAVVLIGSLVSIGGFSAGSALGSPRYAQAIAAHGLLPRRLGDLHLRYHTPYIAIGVTTVFTAILGVFFDYRQLVGMSNITIVIQYFFTCLAVPVLRRKQPRTKGAWRIPGGWTIPALGAAGSLALLAGAERQEVVFAAIALVLGVAVAVVVRRTRRIEGSATRG